MTRFNRQQSDTRTPQIQFDKSKIRFHKKTDLRNVPHNQNAIQLTSFMVACVFIKQHLTTTKCNWNCLH